jgi:predicted aspartyl protease
MGTFYVEAKLSDLSGSQSKVLQVLVDERVSYLQAPGTLLRSVGVTPTERAAFRLGDGSRTERDIGQARLSIGDAQGIIMVVFHDDASFPILGRVTLGEMMLEVAPSGDRVVPVKTLYLANLLPALQ